MTNGTDCSFFTLIHPAPTSPVTTPSSSCTGPPPGKARASKLARKPRQAKYEAKCIDPRSLASTTHPLQVKQLCYVKQIRVVRRVVHHLHLDDEMQMRQATIVTNRSVPSGGPAWKSGPRHPRASSPAPSEPRTRQPAIVPNQQTPRHWGARQPRHTTSSTPETRTRRRP